MAGEKLTVGELVYKISGDMDNLKTELKKAEAEVSNLKSSMEKTSSTTAGMGKQTESTALSVFKGTLAYNAMAEGIKKVGEFLLDSIKESADSARILEQVKTNVENAGFSYEKYAEQINKAGESALQMGFDDDTAGESVSKLLLVTKDMGQAQALLALSMDISRAKNITLEEATKAVILTTQGNSKALKELGIDLKDGATTAELLSEAQDKVKNSAVNYTKTIGGQLDIQAQKWANIKQAVGDKLTPIIMQLFGFIEKHQTGINQGFEIFSNILDVVIFLVSKLSDFVGIAYDSLQSTVALIEGGFTKAIQLVSYGLEKVGLSSKSTTAQIGAMGDSMLDTSKKASDSASNGVSTFFGMTTKATQSTEALTSTLNDTGSALLKVKDKTQNTTGAIQDAKKALEDFQQKMIDVIQKAQDVRKALEKDLGDAFKKFSEDIKSNAKDTVEGLGKMVVDAEAKIKELNQKIVDEGKDLAKKISDIQSGGGDNNKQLQDARDQSAERVKVLQDEIKQNQSILDSRVGFETRQAEVIKGIRKQLADANIDGSKIGLDALLNTKTLEQQIEEDRKNATLNSFQLFEQQQNQKLVALTTALIAEVNLLKTKIETEKKFEADLTAYLQSEQSKRLKGTETWAKGMIKQYKDVADSLQTFLSLQSRVTGLSQDVGLPNNASSSASTIPQTVSNSATTTNKTVNAPVTINATTTSNIDFTAVARDFGFLLSKQ